MPLSRLYAIVSTSPLRTVTLCPTACETSVSAALAPPSRAKRSTSAATASSTRVATGNAVSSMVLEAATSPPLVAWTFNDMVIDGLEVKIPYSRARGQSPCAGPPDGSVMITKLVSSGDLGTGKHVGRPPFRRSRRRGAAAVENATQERDARPAAPGQVAGRARSAPARRIRPAGAPGRRHHRRAHDHAPRGAQAADAVHRAADARSRSGADRRQPC